MNCMLPVISDHRTTYDPGTSGTLCKMELCEAQAFAAALHTACCKETSYEAFIKTAERL